MNTLEIKSLTIRELVGSKGIIIPVQYFEDRFEGGLKVGEIIDIIIKRREE